MKLLLSASIAALVARLITHPLDTLKTARQYDTVKRYGALELYRGLSATLLFGIPGTAVYLTAYEHFKNRLKSLNPLMGHALSACLAELISGVFWTPMEVIKSKLQVGKTTRGSRLYTGYWISQAVFIPYSVIYFLLYEELKLTYNYFVSSLVAAAVAGLASNPLDVIKTRVQVDSVSVLAAAKRGRLFRGAIMRVFWVAPSMSISMAVFEHLNGSL